MDKAIAEINFNDLSKISSQHNFNLNITNDMVSFFFFPYWVSEIQCIFDTQQHI